MMKHEPDRISPDLRARRQFGLARGDTLSPDEATEYAFKLGTMAVNSIRQAIDYDENMLEGDAELADGLWNEGLALRASANDLAEQLTPALIDGVETYLQTNHTV